MTVNKNNNLSEALDYAIKNSKAAASYFTNDFQNEVMDFKNNAARKSGFNELDKEQGALYPGLYVLGAVSSLGKTTFVHQLSDNLASNGDHVLYFSLEQTPFELYSKSIARIVALMRQTSTIHNFPEYSSIELRKGEGMTDPVVQKAIEIYSTAVEDRVVILPSMFSLTIEDIEEAVEIYMYTNHVKPVVVIDYLQIIEASTIGKKKLEAREAIDHIIHSLKSFQSRHNLFVIVISSLNRQNYINPIDFESFKESGGIEYTADVIWGLELDVIHTSDIFAKEGKIKEKRELIAKAKTDCPRKVDLVCLKNRFGISNYRLPFRYTPKADLFSDGIVCPMVSPTMQNTYGNTQVNS